MTPIGPTRPAPVHACPAPQYDFAALATASSELQEFLVYPTNKNGKACPTIDFTKPGATLALTKAILTQHFNISLSLPEGHLVPTIPARQQYLTWAFSLLPQNAFRRPSTFLDVGTGPSAIYCLLAARMAPESLSIVGTDIDPEAIAIGNINIRENSLSDRVQLAARQSDEALIPEESFFRVPLALTVCNPPFYDVGSVPNNSPPAGTRSQMETEGGELEFLCRMVRQSKSRPNTWFTSLVGIKSDVPKIVRLLRSAEVSAEKVVTVELAAGNRTVRWAIGWYFGAERCCVTVRNAVPKSNWRKSIGIKLSAKYAANFGDQDMKLICIAAFRNIGFSTVHLQREASFLRVTDEFGGQLECVSTSNTPFVNFELSIKVAQASGTVVDGIGEIVELMRNEIQLLFDPSPVVDRQYTAATSLRQF
jgi:23S rRNA A1618 N6-methylase RlmF